jgi:hypothetical protein
MVARSARRLHRRLDHPTIARLSRHPGSRREVCRDAFVRVVLLREVVELPRHVVGDCNVGDEGGLG